MRGSTGQIEPIARFMTNPAGAAVVNAAGPIRQIVDPGSGGFDLRRYLAIMTVENGSAGRTRSAPATRPHAIFD
jgi:hypothetical protein